MGAICSKVENGADVERGPSRRMSFMSLKKAGKNNSVIKEGGELFSTYSLGEQVGTDDQVLAAINKENEVEYVARAIEKSEMPCKDLSSVEEHLGILSGLDHVHICRFIEAFDQDERYQLVYEKAKPVTLFEEEKDLAKGKPLNQELCQVYCRQIAMALSVAHKQGIVHGRLRDSSLLIDPLPAEDGDVDRAIKICDIGQTFLMREPRRSDNIEYETPENLWGDLVMPPNSVYMRTQIKTYTSCDLWSLGVLLFRMLTGKMPFHAPKLDLKEAIKGSIVQFDKEWEQMPDARDVVGSLLKRSPRIRITAERILKHPWITLSKARVSKSKMMRVLQNVAFNTTENTFKKFAMRVIAEDMAPEKLMIVKKAFRSIDKNGDGMLNVEEIRQALKKYGEEEGQADEIFEAIDRDSSGTLNFAEFTAVSIGPHEYCDKEILWHTFNRFDKDSNGAFDKDEITTVLREVENLADGVSVQNQVEEIAKDIEMPVDFDTFVQIMVTPAGQPISKFKCSWDHICYQVLKVDNHGVRHITPKTYEPVDKWANPLLKSPYRRNSTEAGSFPIGSPKSSKRGK